MSCIYVFNEKTFLKLLLYFDSLRIYVHICSPSVIFRFFPKIQRLNKITQNTFSKRFEGLEETEI